MPAMGLSGPTVSLIQSLHFPLHGRRGVLSLFPRSLNVLAETVDRVASHVRTRQDQYR